jgi:predicted Zn-dependent protease
MPTRLLIRAGVALLAALGVFAGALTYRNDERVQRAYAAGIEGRSLQEAEDLFESSRALNPGAAREVAEAQLVFRQGRPDRADELLKRAADAEPENVLVWHTWTRLALARRRPAEAQRRWARVRRLDPLLPAQLPPPL